jgi:hypothetical protein
MFTLTEVFEAPRVLGNLTVFNMLAKPALKFVFSVGVNSLILTSRSTKRDLDSELAAIWSESIPLYGDNKRLLLLLLSLSLSSA